MFPQGQMQIKSSAFYQSKLWIKNDHRTLRENMDRRMPSTFQGKMLFVFQRANTNQSASFVFTKDQT